MNWWAVRHRAAHHLVKDDVGYVFSGRGCCICFLIQGPREEHSPKGVWLMRALGGVLQWGVGIQWGMGGKDDWTGKDQRWHPKRRGCKDR